jgi:hypothetical protein
LYERGQEPCQNEKIYTLNGYFFKKFSTGPESFGPEGRLFFNAEKTVHSALPDGIPEALSVYNDIRYWSSKREQSSGHRHLLSGALVWVRRRFLDDNFLPRKGLKRKYRRNCGAIPRNWSGKPGFCVPGTQKCALAGLEKK